MTVSGRLYTALEREAAPHRSAIDRLTGRIRPFKPLVQVALKPSLQLVSPFTGRQKLETKPDFAKGENAGVERFGVGYFQPVLHPFVRLASSIELRKYIRIEQPPAHSSMVRP